MAGGRARRSTHLKDVLDRIDAAEVGPALAPGRELHPAVGQKVGPSTRRPRFDEHRFVLQDFQIFLLVATQRGNAPTVYRALLPPRAPQRDHANAKHSASRPVLSQGFLTPLPIRSKKQNEQRFSDVRVGLLGDRVATASGQDKMAEAGSVAMQGLKVLIVRHGQSTNNVLMERIYAEHGAKSAAAAEKAWLTERSTDPALTAPGQAEAEAFAAHYAPLLREDAGGVRVFCSPFLRTCQTAAPLCAALGIGGGGGGGGDSGGGRRYSCTLRADICEVGGVYTDEGGARSGPGECMGRAELALAYPGYGVDDALPRSGGWWQGGWEDDVAAWRRAKGVAAWLKSRELREECNAAAESGGGGGGGGGGDWVVIVTHGAFTDLLLKALLGLPPAAQQLEGGASASTNQHLVNGGFAFRNTATGTLLVQPNGHVRCLELGSVAHLQGQVQGQGQGQQGQGQGQQQQQSVLTGTVLAAAAAGVLLGVWGGRGLRSGL